MVVVVEEMMELVGAFVKGLSVFMARDAREGGRERGGLCVDRSPPHTHKKKKWRGAGASGGASCSVVKFGVIGGLAQGG